MGEKPEGIESIVRSRTALANTIPCVFMDDSDRDRAAIQENINRDSVLCG